MKTIFCYGDSNTWGYVPGTGERYDENTRWPALLQKKLGAEYKVVECGMNGRMTAFYNFDRAHLNGVSGLVYSMIPSKPIDLLIISLGSNDLKYMDTAGSAKGLRRLLQEALNSGAMVPDGSKVGPEADMILVISPTAIDEDIIKIAPEKLYASKAEESHHFAEHYSEVCREFGVQFLDAAQYARASKVDCLHYDAESHLRLAGAVYEKVREMLGI